MHIHPSSPNSVAASSLQSEEESAAIKIQAGFRGYRVRKQLHSQTPTPTNGYHQRRSTGHRNRRHVMENRSSGGQATNGVGNTNYTASQLREDRSSSEGTSIEDRSATKIQAITRGFLVRKKQKMVTDAATKIQAGFRGFKARREVQKLKQK